MYCSMPKGTCQAEVTSNNEKLQPVALAVIESCLSEGIRHCAGRQAGRQAGGRTDGRVGGQAIENFIE